MDDPVLATMRRRRGKETIISVQDSTVTHVENSANEEALRTMVQLYKDLQQEMEELRKRVDGVDSTIGKIGEIKK